MKTRYHNPLSTARSYLERFDIGTLLPWKDKPSNAIVDITKGIATGYYFDAMPDNPHGIDERLSYDALKRETLWQFYHVLHSGLRIQPWVSEGQPYDTSAAMFHDVWENGHLFYFPTTSGFGDGETYAQHPLYDPVPELPQYRYNDLFRVIHDYFGHAVFGYQFGPTGETRAWDAHARMFSPLAMRALTTETHGQNSWVNYGPHNPQSLSPSERPYAGQKTGILPRHLWPNSI